MKRFWLTAALLAALLAGCGAQTEDLTPTDPTPPQATAPMEPTGYYDPESSLEADTQGAVKAYPLNRSDSMGVIPMGSDLLLLSGTDSTTMTRLTGSNLYVSEVVNLDCFVYPGAPDLQVSETGVTYYDEDDHSLVFLDGALKEVKRVPIPETITGRPAITADRSTIYYCTADSLRRIDLETGLDMLVRELTYPFQSVTQLHCDDTVVQCDVSWDDQERSLYISAETGETLYSTRADFALDTCGDQYFAVNQDGAYQELLTGTTDSNPAALLLYEDFESSAASVLELGGAVLVSSDAPVTATLDFYVLAIGDRSYSLTLDATVLTWSIQADAKNQCIWFLCYTDDYSCDTLVRWDYKSCAVEDDYVYRRYRHTLLDPDTLGLETCKETADQLSAKYGVEICTWTDATAIQPWDYTTTAEYQVPLIQYDLEILDEALSHFPAGMLTEAAAGTDSGIIRICLVRAIDGNPNAGVLDSARGIQFWDEDGNATIAVTMDSDMEQALYHELFHVIESRVMSTCSAYDNWSKLNPKGFDYDYDYVANLSREDYDLLEDDNRAFIDMYSMSYPKEDRARIFEYAMMPDNKSYFQSDIMQAKLKQLCLGIRKAFGLQKSEETFLWEQYLQ